MKYNKIYFKSLKGNEDAGNRLNSMSKLIKIKYHIFSFHQRNENTMANKRKSIRENTHAYLKFSFSFKVCC